MSIFRKRCLELRLSDKSYMYGVSFCIYSSLQNNPGHLLNKYPGFSCKNETQINSFI